MRGTLRFAGFGLLSAALVSAGLLEDLRSARDRQDLPALDKYIAQLSAAAAQSHNNEADYRAGLAYSYAAEVAMELHDKRRSGTYAERGMDFARRAADANSQDPEYHRLLGAMCGQVIPANPIFGGLKYGQCARDEIQRALSINGRDALAYVSQGVGNYYLPPSMGGGPDLALQDFNKAISLDPNLADAYLWKGLALKKENKNGEARAALEKAVSLDPGRLWAKQELDKTPK